MRALRTLYSSPRRALAAIFVFVVIAGAIGGAGTGTFDFGGGFVPSDADSSRAVERVESATGSEPSPGIMLLVDTGSGTGDAAVDAAVSTLSGIDGVAEVARAGTATDGSSALVLGTLDAAAEDEDVATAVLAAFDERSGVTVGGSTIANVQLGDQISEDLTRSELIAFPILVLLALVFFGGRAAVLPVAVGITTVLGTFLALSGINQLYGINVFSLNLVIGLGLGLAVDYTLFLVTRYREELERQGPTFGAVLTTMRTAGRAVVYSAITVGLALATLTVFPVSFLTSMGMAGATVTVVAAAASLIISPVIFGLWGAKLARRRRGTAAAETRWYRFSHLIMRRPGIFAVATTVVMIVLASPALQTTWTPVDATVVPPSQSARTVTDTLERDYANANTTPVSVVVAPGAGAGTASGTEVAGFARATSALPGVSAPAQPVDLGGGTWQVDLDIAGDAAGGDARAVVEGARDLAASSGIDALVAGPAAEFIDQQEAIGDRLLLAVTLLVLLTMLVLWLMTGSVVLPVKAIVMNLLTVGVALGAITWIYQDGRFTDLLGYTPNGGVEPTNFLIAAALVFALSTDYGIFLLERIKEARESGIPERESVATGLARTGSVVTAAAILLAVAIGAFSLGEISFVQQIGIAAAVGVLVDAFVVRSLLVPALMALMGKWNWWAPMWLRRVHDRIGRSAGDAERDVRGEFEAPAPAAVAASDG